MVFIDITGQLLYDPVFELYHSWGFQQSQEGFVLVCQPYSSVSWFHHSWGLQQIQEGFLPDFQAW